MSLLVYPAFTAAEAAHERLLARAEYQGYPPPVGVARQQRERQADQPQGGPLTVITRPSGLATKKSPTMAPQCGFSSTAPSRAMALGLRHSDCGNMRQPIRKAAVTTTRPARDVIFISSSRVIILFSPTSPGV